MQKSIPFLFMRGGSSRGPFFQRKNLPAGRDELSKVLVAALGSGHPLNIDGIGGGNEFFGLLKRMFSLVSTPLLILLSLLITVRMCCSLVPAAITRREGGFGGGAADCFTLLTSMSPSI